MSKINSPFVRPDDRKIKKKVGSGSSVYVDRKVYFEYVETGYDEENKCSIGSVQPVVRETTKDIDKLINSHANEVGVRNLIALYLRTGDSSLFNRDKSINDYVGGEFDATKLPEKSAQEIFNDIPDALKGNKDMEEFLKTLTKDQFEKFVAGLQSEVSKKEKVEEVASNE